jgi:NADP-dependent 3-hydroxy acid dehydrogenase YdfG/acyl carrier protein
LGWQVVNRLIERGARSLAILGRGEPSPTRRESIERFRVAGIQVSFFSVDVADEEAMGRAIAEVNSSLPPLRGIIHAAGTMNSRPEPTPERKSIERILRPKVMGVWNLHHLTRSLPLDFFVTFSSIAAVWGSKGQAEYAAANSFLDRFVHYRRQRGLVGTSINWGPWAGEGMASEERLEWLNRRGIRCLEPSVALAALETLLQSQAAQVTVADVDWNLFQEIYRAIGSSESSLFLELKDFHGDFLPEGERSLDSFPRTDKSDGVVSLSLARQLASVPIGEHPELLRHFLRAKIARVLDIDPERLDENKSLMALGFDSLMAIELKNFCYRELDLEFSISRLMEGASTADITAWILERLSLQSLATPTAGTENDVNDEMEEITL